MKKRRMENSSHTSPSTPTALSLSSPTSTKTIDQCFTARKYRPAPLKKVCVTPSNAAHNQNQNQNQNMSSSAQNIRASIHSPCPSSPLDPAYVARLRSISPAPVSPRATHTTSSSSSAINPFFPPTFAVPSLPSSSSLSASVNDLSKPSLVGCFSPPHPSMPAPLLTNENKTPQHSRSKSDTSAVFSPAGKSSACKQLYGDRFIPNRLSSNIDAVFENALLSPKGKELKADAKAPSNIVEEQLASTYSKLIRNELIGPDVNSPTDSDIPGRDPVSPTNQNRARALRFSSPIRKPSTPSGAYSVSPVGSDSQRLLNSPKRSNRKIPQQPFKILDAPALQDDFYLNLVDWSNQNTLAVALGGSVYLWSACTSKVTKLCELGTEPETVTSVCWAPRTNQLAIGTKAGEVQLWDAVKCQHVRTLPGHMARVGTIAWNSSLLASGSRDRTILLRDPRVPEDPGALKLVGHRQEVCGLKWSFDESTLASGGNDNKLLLWNAHSTSPLVKFSDHTAAVKALAWSPHQHGLLASGGGTADRCIRFWNTNTATAINCVDTGSQVCNLSWSKNVNEIVSTHGYSLNQVIVWKYPTMQKLATLTGHTYRVLYLAISPDGQTVVTGAGDETLRFWNVFPAAKTKNSSLLGAGLSFPSTGIR